MVSIMVVDDNKFYIDSFFKYIIRGNNNLRLTELSYNGIDALKSILELKPDIIILDLDLPELNGLEILKELKKRNVHTNIIVLSARDDMILKVRNDSNVKSIIAKTSGFSMIIEAIEYITEDLEEIKHEKIINEKFKECYFNMNSIGTKYLIRSILIAKKDNEYLKNIEKNLYLQVATFFKTSKEKVKWNINSSIQSMWRYTPDSNKTSIFFNRRNSEKPSASDIINTMVSYLNYSNTK